MGAGASALQGLPDQVPKKQAQALAAATPGLHWDDHIWAEIEHSDGTADKVDIIGLLDQLNLRVRMAEENGEELLAVDGCAVSDDCPGAFSDQSDDDDGLPAMVFADGTGGLVVGAFGEASADVLTLIQRTALFNAERNGLWRCMGASSLEDGAKVLEKRAIRTLGVEGVRGLARARLANLSHVCSTYRQSGPNRGREKAYYENARQAHYDVRTTSRAADNTPPTV